MLIGRCPRRVVTPRRAVPAAAGFRGLPAAKMGAENRLGPKRHIPVSCQLRFISSASPTTVRSRQRQPPAAASRPAGGIFIYLVPFQLNIEKANGARFLPEARTAAWSALQHDEPAQSRGRKRVLVSAATEGQPQSSRVAWAQPHVGRVRVERAASPERCRRSRLAATGPKGSWLS